MPRWLGKIFAHKFQPVNIRAINLKIKVEVFSPTTELDIKFPSIKVTDNLANLDSVRIAKVKVSSIDIPNIFPVPLDGTKPIEISDNLFEPLPTLQIEGKNYTKKKDDNIKQLPILEATILDGIKPKRDGYRQSFQKVARDTIIGPSIWEIILPLLQPPLNPDFPDTFLSPSPLYNFQREGVAFLALRESSLLGDDMGTGKTIQSIVAMRILFQKGQVKSALILVPLSVLKNWDRELEKWATMLKVTVVRGHKEIRKTQWQMPAHIYLTTYDTLREDIDDINRGQKSFDLVIADEVQKIKNPESGYSQSVKGVPCKIRWGLSGTPIENKIDDLVSIFDFIKPKLFRKTILPTPEEAKRLIKPYFLRRRKEDVLKELPEKVISNQWLDLEGEQRAAYDLAKKEGKVYLEELGEKITVQHILARIQKLKEICNVDKKSGKSAKLDWLSENLPIIKEENDKAIIFSQFLDSGVDYLKEELKEYKPVVYKGGLSDSERQKVLDTFKKDNETKLLLMTKAGGLGLNLTSANYVILYDHWWNPAVMDQVIGRVDRIGQEKNVFVYHLWTEDTIEKEIYQILEQKNRLYSDVIDSLSVGGTGLTEDELFALFDLKKPQKKPKQSVRGPIEQGINSFSDLLKLTDKEFENKVSDVYERMGYGVRKLGGPYDKGVDIRATRISGGKELLAIQCKRWEQPVGVPVARELLGVISNNPEYTKGVIVTSSTFTSECRIFCENNGRLELIDGARLIGLIKKLNL